MVKRCSRCGHEIDSTDVVMKVREEHVYHLACFTCCWCNIPLSQGDYFGMNGNLVYCKNHFLMRVFDNEGKDDLSCSTNIFGDTPCHLSPSYTSPVPESSKKKNSTIPKIKSRTKLIKDSSSSPIKEKKRGRPRKRKIISPTEDLSSQTVPIIEEQRSPSCQLSSEHQQYPNHLHHFTDSSHLHYEDTTMTDAITGQPTNLPSE